MYQILQIKYWSKFLILKIFHSNFDMNYLLNVYKCFISAELINDISHYKRSDNAGKVYNKRIRDCICELGKNLAQAKGIEDFTSAMTQFYSRFGVGSIGLQKLYRSIILLMFILMILSDTIAQSKSSLITLRHF